MNRKQKPTIVVVGPLASVGGMATSMCLHLAGSLRNHYQLLPFDNSKLTPPDRPFWRGVLAQCDLLLRLIKLLRRHHPSIVHIHTCSGLSFYRTIADVIIARVYRARVVLHIRGGRFGEFLRDLSGIRRIIVRRALTRVDAVIALSRGWSEVLLKFDPRIPIAVIRNGVVVPKDEVRREERVPLTVVFVGTLRAAKGVDDLLSAVVQLPPAALARLEVKLIGPDPEQRQAELAERVAQLGIAEIFEFCGALDPQEVRAVLLRSAMFVLPSHAEGLPNALLEAMASGVCSVASEVGAIPEVLRDGIDGLLVPPGDPKRLSQAMFELLSDAERRHAMGQAARRRVASEFSQRQVCESIDRLYQRTLAGV